MPDNTTWTFLTNHAHVLLCVASEPDIRLRDLADRVGITERATQRIVSDLVENGYIKRHKNGRRNQYSLNGALPMRPEVDSKATVSALVEALVKQER